MGKPSPPPAPDYVGAAQAQGQANLQAGQQTASLSNPNIYTPLGNQTVSYDATGPNGDYQPTVTRTLTPEAQATLDAQQRVQRSLADLGLYGTNRAQQVMQGGFNPNLPNIQTNVPGLDTSNVAKMPVNAGTTAQQAIMSRLQPQMDRRRNALLTQLQNQGITQGSEAYKNAMTDENQSENDLATQAALQGIGVDMAANQQGYNEALGNYNAGLSGAQFGNQAIQQSLAQQLGLYNQPLNQITALMSGSQVQMPQFQGYSGSNVQAAPIFGATQAAGNYAQNAYAQQLAGYNNMMSGLFGLGGAGMLAFA